MPQLRILINEWESDLGKVGYDSVFGKDAVGSIERKIFRKKSGQQAPKEYETSRDMIRGFVDRFSPELQEIFGIDRESLSSILNENDDQGLINDWNNINAGKENSDSIFRMISAKLFALIMENEPTDVIAEGEADEPAVDTTELPKDKVVPDEFFGRGTVLDEIRATLRTDEEIYRGWRSMLATVQALLQTFGAWFDSQKKSDSISFASIAIARAEIAGIQEEAGFFREVTVPRIEISVPVEPPMQLLSGYPTYNMKDLKLVLAPYVSKSIKAEALDDDWDMSLSSDMTEITINDWSQTAPDDIKRLSDLFLRLRNIVRSPASMENNLPLDPDIGTLLDSLAGRAIQGIPNCWRRVGDLIVGVRPNIIYDNGSFCGESLQLSIVLGAVGEEPIPENFSDELVSRGTVTIWSNRGLLFLGMMVPSLEEMRSRYPEFMEFGLEASMVLSACGASKNIPVEDWQEDLNSLPKRLEMDLGRLRHHWLRERLTSELHDYVAQSRIDEARGLLSRVDDREDRSYLKARFVTKLFDVDKEGSLSELFSMNPGKDRHNTYHSLMEVSVEQDNKELLEEVFGSWLSTDAMSTYYEEDCTPILELAAAGLGQSGILDRYSDELNPGIRSDWIVLVMRRFPSKRRDMEWRRRVDNLINDLKGNGSMNLDRLAGLFETLRKADLPGRDNVIREAIPMLTVEAHRKYYEKRFGIKLGNSSGKAESD